MMSKLRNYINIYLCKFGKPPVNIPMSNDEIDSIKDVPTQMSNAGLIINGVNIHKTYYGAEQRDKILKTAQISFYYPEKENAFLDTMTVDIQSNMYKTITHQIKCQILTEDVFAEVECDPWKWLKEYLHLTRWFPIRYKRINGKVLYPHLNISFPHNRHVIKFD